MMNKHKLAELTRIKGEYYESAALMTQDEAWLFIADSEKFSSQLEELMKANPDMPRSEAIRLIKEAWSPGSVSAFTKYYLRKDGQVEMEY